MPIMRPCLNCRAPINRGATLCPPCQTIHNQQRNQRRTWYAGRWDTLARQIRQHWVATRGEWCPGVPHLGRPPHPAPAATLTVDHVQARDAGELAVLCRTCNGAKGGTEGAH
jgi:hypothetical protein